MKNIMEYFKKTHRIMAVLGYLYGGFGSLCMVLYPDLPLWIKAAVVVFYGVLVFLGIISVIKWNKPGLADLIPPRPAPESQSAEPGQLVEGGIINTHLNKMGNYSEIINHISGAKHSIKIISYYGDNLLKGAESEISGAMKRNVEIQLLIACKGSVLLDEVWELEGEKQAERLDKTREIIEEIRQKAAEDGFRLKYREYNTQARYAVIIVDGKWAWWTPYHPGINVEKTTTLVLTDNSKTSIIWDCINHFDRLWDRLEEKREGASLSSKP